MTQVGKLVSASLLSPRLLSAGEWQPVIGRDLGTPGWMRVELSGGIELYWGSLIDPATTWRMPPEVGKPDETYSANTIRQLGGLTVQLALGIQSDPGEKASVTFDEVPAVYSPLDQGQIQH